MSGEIRTPDQVSTNEITLICVKLLGLHWKYIAHAGLCAWANDKGEVFSINRFDTWAEAGLILDALRGKGMVVHFFSEMDGFHVETFARDSESAKVGFSQADADAAPMAIRAAALEYIRSQS